MAGTVLDMGMFDCKRGKRHDYEWLSGWCKHGCGVRDDGRVVTFAGDVLSAGRYTDYSDFMAAEHAEELKAEHERRIAEYLGLTST